MLVVKLYAGGDAATVVDHTDRVVEVDGDHDIVAMPCQRLIDRVVDDLKHQVVQTGTV